MFGELLQMVEQPGCQAVGGIIERLISESLIEHLVHQVSRAFDHQDVVLGLRGVLSCEYILMEGETQGSAEFGGHECYEEVFDLFFGE